MSVPKCVHGWALVSGRCPHCAKTGAIDAIQKAQALALAMPVAVQALKHCIFALTSVNMLSQLPKETKHQLSTYINEAEAALNTLSTAMGGNRGEGNTPHSDR